LGAATTGCAEFGYQVDFSSGSKEVSKALGSLGLHEPGEDFLKAFNLVLWVTLTTAALWLVMVVVMLMVVVARLAALGFGKDGSDEEDSNGGEGFQKHGFSGSTGAMDW